MGDGKIKRFALLINGDTEPRHLANVEMALKVLQADGYVRFVASPQPTQQIADHYLTASPKTVKDLVAQLKSQIDDDDELVIYTTGHGGIVKGEAHLCLKKKCESNLLSPELINEIPYGSRTIVMDQCMGGSWGTHFLKSAHTLFVAAGSKKEEVCCTEFAPRFWNRAIPDLNHDGIITFQERYAHVVQSGISQSTPQFVPSRGYPFAGKAPFSTQVGAISTKNDLQKELSRLEPGQYAIVTYSTSWCIPCKTFKPQFEQLAKDAGGHFLFLRSANESLALSLGFNSFPTVVAYDHTGHHIVLKRRDDLFANLAQFHVSDTILGIRKLERKVQEAENAIGMKQTTALFQTLDDCKSFVAGQSLSTLATLGKNILHAVTGYPVDIPDETTRHEEREAFSGFLQKYQLAIGKTQPTESRVELQIELGNIMRGQGFSKMASSLLGEAQKSAAALSSIEKKTSFLIRIVDSHIENRDKRSARATVDALLKLWVGGQEDGMGYTTTLTAAAVMMHRLGERKRSEALFEQAVHVAEPLNTLSLWSDIAVNLAKAGKRDSARHYFSKIESSLTNDMRNRTKLVSDIVVELAMLAASMRTSGFVAESERLLDTALQVASTIANPNLRMSALIDIARHLGSARSAAILKLAIHAADSAPTTGKRIENLSTVLLALPRVSTSIPLLRDIEQRVRQMPASPERTKLTLDVAENMGRQGQDTLALLKEILTSSPQVVNIHSRILLLAKTARELQRNHEDTLAEATFNQAMQLCQQMQGTPRTDTLINLANKMLLYDYREGALQALRMVDTIAQQDNNHSLQRQINALMLQNNLISLD